MNAVRARQLLAILCLVATTTTLFSLAQRGAAVTQSVITDSAPPYMGPSSPPTVVLSMRIYNETNNALNRIIVNVTNVSGFDPNRDLMPLANDSSSGLALYRETNGIPGFQDTDSPSMNGTIGWLGGPVYWGVWFDNLATVNPYLPQSDPVNGDGGYYLVARTSSGCLNGSVFNVSLQTGMIDTTFGAVPAVGVWSKDVTIDTKPPTTNISLSGPVHYGAFTYVSSATSFNLSAADWLSGVQSSWYRIWNGAWKNWTRYTLEFGLTGGDGLCYLEFNSTDNVSLSEVPNNVSYYLDASLPVTSLNIGNPNHTSGGQAYVTSTTQFTLSSNDVSGSDVRDIWYRTWNGTWSSWTNYTSAFSLSGADGIRYIEYNATDNVDNKETPRNHSGTIGIYLDNGGPATALSVGNPNSTTGGNTSFTSATQFALSSSDGPGSGVQAIWYRTWNASGWSAPTQYAGAFAMNGTDGPRYVEYNGTDNLGNLEAPKNYSSTSGIQLDNGKPMTALSMGGPNMTAGGQVYFSSATQFALASDDGPGSGVQAVWYRTWSATSGWGAPVLYTGAFTFSGSDGLRFIEYNATDRVGNGETPGNSTAFANLYYDGSSPATTLGITGTQMGSSPTMVSGSARFSLSSGDTVSGLAGIEYSVDGGAWTQYQGDFGLTGLGGHNISYRAIDNLGNLELVKTFQVYVNHPPGIATAPVTGARSGEPYGYDVDGTDYESGPSLTFSLLEAPDGMEMDPATGIITWNPTDDDLGAHSVTVLVSDGLDSNTQVFTISVEGAIVPMPPMMTPEYIAFLGIFAAALALSAGSLVTERGTYGSLALFIPLYTRLKKEETLDHFTRGRIYGYIQANPGEHLNAIKRALDLNNGSIVYHLSTLSKMGYIYSRNDRSYKRFYPSNTKLPRRNLGELTPIQRNIVDFIHKNPATSQVFLAESLMMSKQLVNYHIRLLRDAGIVVVRQDDKRTYCHIADDFSMKG